MMANKGDLTDFERGVVVAARWVGLNISETPNILGYFFPFTTISKAYRENPKTNTMSEWQRKCLVDTRGKRGIFRQLQMDKKAR